MYRRATSTRLSRGRSTPAIRAIPRSSYPCRCLWRGFEQITMTRPWRRISLHFSHILFTDGRTFMLPLLSPVPVDDPPSRQVVRRELHQYPVPREDPDVVHPHLPGDVGQDPVSVVKLHPEHGIGQGFDHRALDLDGIFLRQAPGIPLRT